MFVSALSRLYMYWRSRLLQLFEGARPVLKCEGADCSGFHVVTLRHAGCGRGVTGTFFPDQDPTFRALIFIDRL